MLWYPSLHVWTWRRTLSYWISVTFFEGSLFFTISSFLLCYPQILGRLELYVTTFGYLAGKINFTICCYLMCVETINLSNAHSHGGHQNSVDDATSETSGSSSDSDEDEVFKWWPFHVRTALRKLDKLGAGPWPYWASVTYFVGCLIFTIGFVAEMIEAIPKEVNHWIQAISFLLGSLLFLSGGIAECIENEVFTSFKLSQGWVGALFNVAGGALFTIGACMLFFPGTDYASNFTWGVGSAVFAIASAVMIIMWKDEQFGLTFLAVLNELGGPARKAKAGAKEGAAGAEEEAAGGARSLSTRAAIFVMIYVATGVASVYNFLILLANVDQLNFGKTVELAFNALLPCVFAHFMLALTVSVSETPTMAPFHQLYIACRYLTVLMLANSTARFIQALVREAVWEHPVEPA